MSDPTDNGRYRLNTVMKPMSGQPVNWNARAVIWSGCDRRYWVRRVVWCLSAATAGRAGVWKRVHLWLFRLVDDRDRSYSTWMRRWRRLLNTQADVRARKAWAETNRYWRACERRRREATRG